MTFKGLWRFLVSERLGYRRSSGLTPYDHWMRHEAERRSEQLDGMVMGLNLRARLLSRDDAERGNAE